MTTVTSASGRWRPDSSDSTPTPGPVEHGQGRLVGRQVAAVLAWPSAGQTPVVETAQGLAHRRRRLVEQATSTSSSTEGRR